jgi:hypothetical protein
MFSFLATNTTFRRSNFAGQDFSNNLLSDLAPLLTLFGDQVTKQFLSMSTGWADNVLIAFGPLGIMTVVVSAIRVGGLKKLKAIVGRAREGKAAAELELLSSTSSEVCELWNGQSIVRQLGVADTKEFVVFFEKFHEINTDLGVQDLRSAFNSRILTKPDGTLVSVEDQQLLWKGSPNLTLNTPGAVIGRSELWGWVLFGSIIQCGVLILPAILQRYKILALAEMGSNRYGYPCFLIGSVALTVGMVLCSHTIEAKTTEYEIITNSAQGTWSNELRPVGVYCYQPATTVGDQHYDPYLILNAPGDCRIRFSRWNDKDLRQVMSVLLFSNSVCS